VEAETIRGRGVVEFDSNQTIGLKGEIDVGNGLQPMNPLPSEYVLGHELIHALDHITRREFNPNRTVRVTDGARRYRLREVEVIAVRGDNQLRREAAGAGFNPECDGRNFYGDCTVPGYLNPVFDLPGEQADLSPVFRIPERYCGCETPAV
jgi:hypothetical protein